MKLHYLAFIFFVVFCVVPAEFAKILAIFPMPSPSHYIFVEPLLKKLVERGHELTVVGVYPQKKPLQNFRDIIVEKNIKLADEILPTMTNEKNAFSIKAFFTIMKINCDVSENVLENKEFRKFLDSPKGKFDLIINEVMWVSALCGVGEHFNAPMIAVSPFGAGTIIDETVGNISPNSIVPNTLLPYSNRINFLQRFHSFLSTIMDGIIFGTFNDRQQKSLYEKYFPNAKLSFLEARSSYALLLVNQHYSLSYPRPYVTNVIEAGGLHISENPDPLPADLQKFLDSATDGAIYFSMGSNLKSKDLQVEKLNIFLNVFRSLKQKVLWKFEDPHMPNKPDNVFISPWCPQLAILKHPNVKVFITHGGLLSVTESIFYGKPMLGIPIMAEQPRNVAIAVNRGIALNIDFYALNEKDLKNVLNELIYNPKYKEKIEEVSKQFHDKPMSALETAVFWVEYVLRHNGAKHLESAVIQLNLLQYYSVDVVTALVFIVFVILYLIIWIFKKIISICCGFRGHKKTNKNEKKLK